MVSDFVREKALALANAILETEEYKDFLEKEELLKNDAEAQTLLAEFQQKQKDFISRQLAGEVDQQILGELTDIQAELNTRESVANFLESYNRFVSMLGEVGNVISKQIDFDFGEAYRT
jgi:cell fate (sporulation/competence/biofilm development) regulator YlbF (YheA/YmcA/DUF963 family)